MSLPVVKPNQTKHYHHLFLRSLGIIGGLSLLGSGLWGLPGNATETLVIDAPAPIAPPAESAPSTPAVSSPDTYSPSPIRRRVFQSRVRRLAQRRLAAPRISLNDAPVRNYSNTIREGLQGKNNYVDNGGYRPKRSAVVLTERSSGCQTIAQGNGFSRGCGVSVRPRRSQNNQQVARSLMGSGNAIAKRFITPRYQRVASRQRVSPQSLISRAPRYSPTPLVSFKSHRYQPNPSPQGFNSGDVFSLEPIIRRGIAIALAPLPEYTRATSMYEGGTVPLPNSNTDLLFPVPTAAPITSAFGWRVHPISGTSRMHQGTDIGAPLGTPVLAAYGGEVASADWSGGYGMMVVLRHLQGTQESRYAHLSEILVTPGQAVEQGEIIGRVGSTGFSTGPHLHFEWRRSTKDGWTAVDAGQHLQYALENLIQAQQLAKAPETKPQG